MAELTWTANTNVNWVRVSPSTGVGSNNNVSVSIDAASGPNDESSATITITTSTGDIQQIPVTRCLPECSCKSLGFVGQTLNNLPQEGATSVLIATYNSSSTCKMGVVTDGIVLTNPTNDGNGNIYADVNSNNGSARTGYYRLLYDGEICVEKTVTQQKHTNPCDEASCPSVTFAGGGTSINVGSNGGTYEFTISGQDCWSEPRITPGESWASVNGSNIIVSENGGTSPTRTSNVTFTFTNNSNGSTCKAKLSISQIKQVECFISGPDEINSCNGGTQQYEITS